MEDIKRCLVCDERKEGCNLTCKKHYLAYKEKYEKYMRKYKATEERKIKRYVDADKMQDFLERHFKDEWDKKQFSAEWVYRFIEISASETDGERKEK